MTYLEICTATPHSIDAAYQGGADRIELCTGLEMGGLTPSPALLQYALDGPKLPVHVLIRPRPGNFVYSELEMDIILNDIIYCRDKGAAGVVCGALTMDGHYDLENIRRMIDAAGPLPFTFHRGVDYSVDGLDALESLIEIGVKRILTSGAAASSLQGAERIREMQQRFGNRLQIMPGGGIDNENLEELILKTGVSHVHLSAKATVVSGQQSTSIAAESLVKTKGYFESQEHIVRACRMVIDKLANQVFEA
jgi:copper homeostasis protein